MAHQTVSDPAGEQWDVELVPTANGRTNRPSEDCPVEVSLSAIAGRWTTLVLRELMSGEWRSYSDLATSLPNLSDKVLSERLRALIDAGFLERARTDGYPPRTAYHATARAQLLRPLLIELYRTGLALQADDAAGF